MFYFRYNNVLISDDDDDDDVVDVSIDGSAQQ